MLKRGMLVMLMSGAALAGDPSLEKMAKDFAQRAPGFMEFVKPIFKQLEAAQLGLEIKKGPAAKLILDGPADGRRIAATKALARSLMRDFVEIDLSFYARGLDGVEELVSEIERALAQNPLALIAFRHAERATPKVQSALASILVGRTTVSGDLSKSVVVVLTSGSADYLEAAASELKPKPTVGFDLFPDEPKRVDSLSSQIPVATLKEYMVVHGGVQVALAEAAPLKFVLPPESPQEMAEGLFLKLRTSLEDIAQASGKPFSMTNQEQVFMITQVVQAHYELWADMRPIEAEVEGLVKEMATRSLRVNASNCALSLKQLTEPKPKPSRKKRPKPTPPEA